MAKVLIISPSFAPQAFVGGVRTTMFAKYLTHLGWEVWVLTRIIPAADEVTNSGLQVTLPDFLEKKIIRIQSPNEQEYLAKRSFKTKIRDFFSPEYSSPPGFLDQALPIGMDLIQREKFDVILSSAPDQWGITLGHILAKSLKCRFVVDFRDIFEQEIFEKRSLQENIHRRRMLRKRNRTANQADLITTVSLFHQKVLQQKFGIKTAVIYNGYDHELFFPFNLKPNDSCFRISYLGRILSEWYHNPKLLFQALDEIGSESQLSPEDLQVNFYGVEKSKLEKHLTEKNKKFIAFHPRVATLEVPRIMNESQALLLITNKERHGVMTTKFFEYTGVKKPVLCIPGDGSELQDLIDSQGFGTTVDSVEELKKYIYTSVEAFRSGTWPNHLSTDPEFFTRKNQTQILSFHLNELV
ncbi:glycosyltransferase [Algoriphagus confluentis]|uniref:Glycosyltransferase subfamily 4-like N-terminal domain-containing protein n=1 Tax=Algoriphagus confluentis TaxID=1697556 RepID=A0ABQ6PNM5_9BACT|nr:hypothetical protein Aconfl_21740 [Algoriphagus confluentis]